MRSLLLLLLLASGNSVCSQLTHEWVRGVGSSNDEQVDAVTVDNLGNSYAIGQFSGTFDFDPGPAVYNLTASATSYIRKLDPNGDLIWVYLFNGGTYARDLTFDNNGYIIVTGSFAGWTDLDLGPGISAHSAFNSWDEDAFIAKYDLNMNFEWSRSFGNDWFGSGESVSVDASGNCYLSGIYMDSVDFDPGFGVTVLNNWGHHYIMKFDSWGNFQWAGSIGGFTGGSHYCEIKEIVVSDGGNVYITGQATGNVDLDPSFMTQMVTTDHDYFLIKINTSGWLAWSHVFPAAGFCSGEGIALDQSENVITTGYYTSYLDFDPGPGVYDITISASNCSNQFVHKLSSSGNVIWAEPIWDYSGVGPRGLGVDVDEQNNIYAVGTFADYANTNIPSQSYTNGGNDVLLVKLSSGGAPLIERAIGSSWNDLPTDVQCAPNNAVYVAGYFVNTIDFHPNGSGDTLIAVGGQDAFLQKYGCFSEVIDEQFACDSFTWMDGNTYFSSTNNPTWTLTNVLGCDSIITLDLTIYSADTIVDIVNACNSYTWIDGNTYTTSTNLPTWTLTSAGGCDSIVSLDLTVNYPVTSTNAVVACDSYTWIDGNTYTTSTDIPTWTLTSAAGCDSILTLDLTINNTSSSIENVTTCDSLTWNGTNYTASGTYNWMGTNALGCDSSATLILIINNSSTGTAMVEACNSFLWEGTNYTTSGIYTALLTNAAGCDSTATLDLTINNSSTSTSTITACSEYTWNGTTYTSSGTYTWIGTNAVGCDSTATLNLTINTVDNSVTQTDDITLQANSTGATYQWLDCDNGYAVIAGATNQSYTATTNGNYAVQVEQNGCIDTSACMPIISVGLYESFFDEMLVVYPNPTSGAINVSFGKVYEEIKVVISDARGRKIRSHTFNDVNEFDLDITDENPGTYFLDISSGNRHTTRSIVKE